MRLENIQKILKEHQCDFEYTEEDGLGSIDLVYRGIRYYIWEFEDGGRGVETNIRNAGRSEDITGNYEEELEKILRERLVS